MRRPQEEYLAATCHLLNAVPLWGLLFCGWVWFDNREKSRYLVDQSRQAIVFQCLFLGVLLVWIIFTLIGRLLGMLFPPAMGFMDFFSGLFAIGSLILYIAICIQGAVSCLTNTEEPFRYPIVGRRVEN